MSRPKKIEKLINEGKFQDAIDLIKDEMKEHPDYPDLYNQLSIVLLLSGKTDDAMKVLLSGLKVSPNYLEARFNLILILIETGQYSFAQKQLKILHEKMTESDFKNLIHKMDECREFVDLGDMHEEVGMYEKAIAEYLKALEIMPQFADIHFKLAKIYSEIGKYDLAFGEFSKALNINPDFEKARLQRGVLYFKRGMRKEAMEEWERILKDNPNSKKAKAFLDILKEQE